MAESRAAAESIWVRPAPTARQPRFSRDQIAAAALAIADAEGFEAVSMRRIAALLGAGTMSLYRYVETKAELLALMEDALIGEALVPGGLPADWREALTLVAQEVRAAYLRHPWAVQALAGRPAACVSRAGPNGRLHFEQSLTALADAPLTTQAKLDLLAILDDYVTGHLLHAADVARAGHADAVGSEFAEARRQPDLYPLMAALADDPHAAALTQSRLDQRFAQGLRLLLDGATPAA